VERALILAEPAGCVRAFVDEGAAMAELLRRAVERDVVPDYARRLLRAFAGTDTSRPATAQDLVGGLVEPLSERETEVLHLIAEGLTNREIGERLFISMGTVKVHTARIYGKLDVHSRTQAVARARSLGMLDSI
jgi:LuxR family maltose regulon positive regulatory protein